MALKQVKPIVLPARREGTPSASGPERFLRRLETAHPISADERAALWAVCAPQTGIAPRTDLIVEGLPITHGYIFEAGWACRYRVLSDGRRQIINFIVPGDFVGGFSSTISRSDHSVAALTQCDVHAFKAVRFAELRQQMPRLQRAFEWSARRDLAILQERVVDLGRRTARERVAHLMLELMHRLRLVGMCDAGDFALPLTQEVLADALGLSIVHVNRTLRQLNEDGLLVYRPGRVTVLDAERLAATAEFDHEYLHQPPVDSDGSATIATRSCVG